MQHESHYINVGPNHYHYSMFGNHDQYIIAFNGFYHHSTSFAPVFEALAKEYSVLSIDLPHHGKTQYSYAFFESKDLLDLVNNLLAKHKIASFHIWAYSIGGRIALKLTTLLPQQVNSLMLCACDGLKKDFFYHLATRNSIGKRLFNYFTSHPKVLLSIVKQLDKLKIFPERTMRFAQKNVENKAIFDKVKIVWPCFSTISVHTKDWAPLLERNKTPVHFIMAKFDSITPAQPAIALAKQFQNIQITILKSGHDLTSIHKQNKIISICLNHLDKPLTRL